MKNIIVPIDFSEECLKALDFVVMLSKKLHLNVQMVYVQKKSTESNLRAVEEEREIAEKKFEKLIEIYQKKMQNDSRLRYVIKKGRVYQEVVNQANSYNECVIVASTSGASGFEEVFIGSNAQKIVSVSEKPVITIRKQPVPEDIQNIIMPVDDSLASRQKAPFTADLAFLLGATIHVVATCRSQKKQDVSKVSTYVKQIVNYLDNRGINNETKYLYGDNMTDQVIFYTEQVKGDLIVINKEKTTSLLKIFSDISQLMINKSPVPVLSYTPKELGLHISFNA